MATPTSDPRTCRTEGCDRPTRDARYTECRQCIDKRRGRTAHCGGCGTEFHATVSQVEKATQKGNPLCCSKVCHYEVKMREILPASGPRICKTEGCMTPLPARDFTECPGCCDKRRGEDRTCGHCQETFRATASQLGRATKEGRTIVYCSRSCSSRATADSPARQAARAPKSTPFCDECGAPSEYTLSNGRVQRGALCVGCYDLKTGEDIECGWCMKPFRARASMLRGAREKEERGHREVPGIGCSFVCGHLLRSFRMNPSCSTLLSSIFIRQCPTCGDWRVDRLVRAYCRNETCEANRPARGVLGRRTIIYPCSQQDLADRDGGWECGICGVPTHPDVPPHHPMKSTYDHIIPVAIGGTDDVENFQLAHRRCNLSRSDKPLEEAREIARTRSPDWLLSVLSSAEDARAVGSP